MRHLTAFLLVLLPVTALAIPTDIEQPTAGDTMNLKNGRAISFYKNSDAENYAYYCDTVDDACPRVPDGRYVSATGMKFVIRDGMPFNTKAESQRNLVCSLAEDKKHFDCENRD